MLGALANGTFSAGTVNFHPGHTLIACSDGVTECQNSHDEEFELKRLLAAAQAAQGRSVSQTLFSALGAVLDFADGCPLSDDLTLLVVRRDEAIAKLDRSGDRDSLALVCEQVETLRNGRRRRLIS